jgi:hypothetical protein
MKDNEIKEDNGDEEEEEEEIDDDHSPIIHDKWDVKFIDLPNDDVFEIIFVANYLDIKSLLNLGCKQIAQSIKDKSIDEIKTIFGYNSEPTEVAEKPMETDEKVVSNETCDKKNLSWADSVDDE